MRVVFASLFALILAGCAGNTPWKNPQQWSGINEATIEANCPEDVDAWCPATVHILGGKEAQRIGITYRKEQDGTTLVKYEAVDVKAFEGQQIRAAVEEAVSEDAKEVAPGIVDTVTSAVLEALAL